MTQAAVLCASLIISSAVLSSSWQPRTYKTTPRQLIHHLSPSLFSLSQSFSLAMAGYHNPLPYAVGVIPAMCNHQAPVSLRIPEITSTWTGKDIPIEDASTGLPMFFVSGKGTSWSGRKRMCTYRLICGVASRLRFACRLDGRARRAVARAHTGAHASSAQDIQCTCAGWPGRTPVYRAPPVCLVEGQA
jgi:hypothetical protein